jgi:hypothetical protein
MITIPDDATPADIVGETDILAGQDWLNKALLLRYANAMAQGEFPWGLYNLRQPMAFQVGSNGRVINQGHHRWVAARLARVEIPFKIKEYDDYMPDPVPFAIEWVNVVWRTDEEARLG